MREDRCRGIHIFFVEPGHDVGGVGVEQIDEQRQIDRAGRGAGIFHNLTSRSAVTADRGRANPSGSGQRQP